MEGTHPMMAYPIPTEALDDRHAWVGTAGAGKTYNAGSGVEQLLAAKSRVVIIDPLDVWWGLRLNPDGKGQSRFKPVIFGGPHGDLPLNEHSGALLGEACATMRESCIISLADLKSKAAERRFMLAFLTALERNANREPVHLVFDEADLWAPQRILDKDGEATKLLGMMEQIVRRGRIKGFIPWLITQRPAVLSKNVLSQADGLIAFKLTSSQDRDAIGAWIEGQADKAVGAGILASLPGMQMGQGVVWIPGRGILETAQFPAKATFDSSRTPKRGEVVRATALKPIDLGALKTRLAKVEEEAKANDPKALKAEITRLKAAVAKAPAATPDAATLERVERSAERAGYDRGYQEGLVEGEKRGNVAGQALMLTRVRSALDALRVDPAPAQAPPPTHRPLATASPAPPTHRPLSAAPPAPPRTSPPVAADADAALSGPQRQLLGALAWWKGMGHSAPSRPQIAAIAGWKITSGHLKNVIGSLRTRGLVDYPQQSTVTLTPAGVVLAPEPDMGATLHERLKGTLTGPQNAIFDVLVEAGEALTREELAARCGWEPTSGHLKNVIGSMKTLEIVEYPAPAVVALQSWVNA
jgi:hypothetical protein